jgi:Zn-dependent peptidase ImmA (M78 family)/DNA-binding XRE family transcriptional regulator
MSIYPYFAISFSKRRCAMSHDVLSKNLRRIRSIQKLSQAELAENAGINRISYVQIESGETNPRSSTLIAIAKALNIGLADLFKPLPSLSHVRFRINKKLTQREENSREQLLQDVSLWLKDYQELEEILKIKPEYRFSNFNENDPEKAAMAARKLLKLDNREPVRDVCGLIEKAGIRIYLSSSQFKKYFGLSISPADGGPAICVRVGNDVSVERQIFTVAHEFGHLLLHGDSYKKDETDEIEQEETQADLFAGKFLMPDDSFLKEWDDTRGIHFVDRVLHVKRIFKVSYRTILVRLVSLKLIGSEVYAYFNVEYKKRYNHDLKDHYEPNSYSEDEPAGLLKSDFMEDRWNRLVREAYEKELISINRAAELLKLSIIEMRELNNSWKMA